LDCNSNQIKTLDVSDCVLLESLYFGDNQLTTLDVSKLGKLTYLDVYYNNLSQTEANIILGDLPEITDGRGNCGIKEQTGVTLDGLIDISGKGWDVS
jgi:Leucine-rich repeat (LRR) protein